MSINHYSSDTPETTLWWTQHQNNPSIPIHPSWNPQSYHQQQEGGSGSGSGSWTHRFNLNIQDEDEEDEENDVVVEESTRSPPKGEEEEEEEEEKEAMFEKPLTPSDVGKLNRLVIPKQHAERYFPLDSEESKGLLLSFEDESGKCWRFRYSYWNSSQSYVLTKGWSRYVKDKRLDAGDVVLFHRHRTHSQRFFITWRRRHLTATAHLSTRRPNCTADGNGNGEGSVPVVGWTRGFYPAHPYPAHHQYPFPYQTDDSLHAGGGSQQGQNQSTPGGNSSSSSTSRVLRLFGVNMECQPDNNNSQNSTPECSYNMSSTQGTATPQFYYHHPPYSSSNPHHHMVVRQMRNRQGQGQVDTPYQN